MKNDKTTLEELIEKHTENIERGRCPRCGYVFECATNLEDEKYKPKVGDIAFCIKCGAANQYDKVGVIAIDESKLDADTKLEILRIREAWERTKDSGDYIG